MKKQLLSLTSCVFMLTAAIQAQEIPANRVPSVILNEFQAKFPKANDIEWEKTGELYNVEFETGWSTDHEVWYDNNGQITRHKEDITEDELPKKVKQKIITDFEGFTIDDIERETTSKKVIYHMDLDSFTQDWEIIIDESGEIINKVND